MREIAGLARSGGRLVRLGLVAEMGLSGFRKTRLGAVFRRAGFDGLPRLGACSVSRKVETIGFDYLPAPCGRACRSVRRSATRLRARRRTGRERLGDDHVIDLAALGADVRNRAHARRRHRNGRTAACRQLLCPAAIWFFSLSPVRSPIGAARQHLVAGMCETDYSGYPDCRDDTIKAMQVALTSRHGPPISCCIRR